MPISSPLKSMSVGSPEDESISELSKMNYFLEKRDCKEPTKDESELEMNPPLMPGEYMRFIGQSCEGLLGLTNFRLLQPSEVEGQFRVNVPIRMLDAVIGTELFVVLVHTKDAGAIKFSFSTNDMATVWRSRLTDALAPLPSLDAFFAFHFKAFLEAPDYQDFRRIFDSNHGSDVDLDTDRIFKNGVGAGELDDILHFLHSDEAEKPKWRRPDEVRALVEEFRRMGFPLESWRISAVNCGYRVCETYPEAHIAPARFKDKDLKEALEYRAAHRFPSVTWRSRRTGAVIARCSQPGTGFFSARNAQDEELLCEIVAASKQSSQGEEEPQPSMLIVDARSYSAAFANRARGYGTELADYYPKCRIEFGNLANIHAVRAAYDALRSAGLTTTTSDFQLAVSGSRWLQYVAQLLHCSKIIIDSIEKGCPVVVHCSDGWDRTPQLTAISQVCLDPHYRTVAGFRTLVEREWLAFGHKFADRCGHDTTSHRSYNSEKSQVFVQWLDAIYQIVSQFPTAFEYNSYFLKKLAIHTNSCLFGTFLLNSSKTRAEHQTIAQTCSVWDYLRPESNWRILNLLYSEQSNPEVLRPSSCTRDMLLWRDFYCSHWPTADAGDIPSGEPSPASYHLQAVTATMEEEEEGGKMARSLSVDAVSAAQTEQEKEFPSNIQQSSSDLMLCYSSPMISSSDTVVMKPSVTNGASSADHLPIQAANGHAGRGLTHCASGSSINGFLGASFTSIEALDQSAELFPNVERHLQRQARSLAREKSRINGLSSPPRNFQGLDWDALPMPILTENQVVRILLVQYERQLAVERMKRAVYRRRASKAEQEKERLRSEIAALEDKVRRLQRSEDRQVPALLPSSGTAIAPGYFDVNNSSYDQPLALISGENNLHRQKRLSSSASDIEGHSESLSSVGSDYERINDPKPIQYWEPNDMVSRCNACSLEFSYLLVWKHHCRKCGLIFCDSCSRYRVAVPEQRYYEPVRVCYQCYESLTSSTSSPCGASNGRSSPSPSSSLSSVSTSSTVISSKCGEASSAKEASNGAVRASTAYVMG